MGFWSVGELSGKRTAQRLEPAQARVGKCSKKGRVRVRRVAQSRAKADPC